MHQKEPSPLVHIETPCGEFLHFTLASASISHPTKGGYIASRAAGALHLTKGTVLFVRFFVACKVDRLRDIRLLVLRGQFFLSELCVRAPDLVSELTKRTVPTRLPAPKLLECRQALFRAAFHVRRSRILHVCRRRTLCPAGLFFFVPQTAASDDMLIKFYIFAGGLAIFLYCGII